MRAFQPYLVFDGTTRDAMTFYHQVLGGDLMMQTFADAKMGDAPGTAERILHARITRGSAVLMASDSMPGTPFTAGTNFSVSIDCESLEEIERLYPALAAGGTPTMPLQDTFWGARFGMLIDRFGTSWMFNFEQPKG